MKTPEPIGQQSRWVEQLAAFDFEVIHRPGVRHQNADSISRIPCRQCGWEGEPVDVVAPVKEEEILDLSPDAMKDLQLKDPDITEFCELMRNYPDRRPSWKELDGLSEETKIMWRVWNDFEMVDDVLFRRSVSPVTEDIELRLVIPKAVRRRVFHLIHDDMTGGHLGVVRTREQLRRRVYWPGWSKDVDLYVKACEQCARFHRGKPPKQGTLQPMLASSVWETIGIDLTGPHPRSASGYKYILTVVDHFSKFAFAFPLRNMEAATIARILVDNVFCLVGAPYRILTDQGPNFEGLLFKELCKAMGIAKIRTSPYKPSTNGITERFHQTLNSMIAKCIKESQRDWDLRLPMVLAAYRASCHSATSLTPNRIVFGRENTLPADLVLCDADKLPRSENSVVELVAEQQERFRSAYQLAREYLKVVAQRRKSHYDVGVKAAEICREQPRMVLLPEEIFKEIEKMAVCLHRTLHSDGPTDGRDLPH